MTVLTPLEIATGTVLGIASNMAPLAPSPRPLRASLEAEIIAGLREPPCRVSFSGGLDSSVILMLAADLARREDLPLPVPVSARFPAIEETREDEWQGVVIDAAGLRDRWIRLEFDDELGLVGPHARSLLAATGEVYWPWNLHLMLPIAEAGGSGGCLLTGVGGDELLNFAGWARLELVLMGRHRPHLSDLPALLVPFAPATVRGAALFAARRLRTDWLRSGPGLRFSWTYARYQGRAGRHWDRALLDTSWRSRYLQVPRRFNATVQELTGTRIVHPFQAPGVLASAATHFGRRGPTGREAALVGLGGELLPPSLLARRDKALFNDVMWTPATHRFAERALESLPPAVARLVDETAVRRTWAETMVPSTAYSMLQAAWLAEGLPEVMPPPSL